MIYILCMSVFMPAISQVDFVESFSGDHRVTRTWRQQGYLAAHFDIERVTTMDILSSIGLTARASVWETAEQYLVLNGVQGITTIRLHLNPWSQAQSLMEFRIVNWCLEAISGPLS
jgi:hypothetical protein